MNLRNANLGRAVLRGTYCHYSDFSEASLVWADVQRANLSHSTFYQTELNEANLGPRQPVHANFNMTRLEHTNLTGS